MQRPAAGRYLVDNLGWSQPDGSGYMKQLFTLLAALPLALGGCAVYVPMPAAAPQIRHRGELEATAGWSLTNRLDAAAAYSPLPHVLLRGGVSLKGQGNDPADTTTHARNHQYELGLGTYWPLGQHWLVGGLVGFGQAHALASYERDGNPQLIFFGQPPLAHHFDAHYRHYAGEVYATWQPTRASSLGLAWRLVQVRLTDVTDRGVPVLADPIVRAEPMLYYRLRPGGSEAVQLQVAFGVSQTLHYDPRTAFDGDDPVRQFRLGQSYLLVGVVLRPPLGKRLEQSQLSQ